MRLAGKPNRATASSGVGKRQLCWEQRDRRCCARAAKDDAMKIVSDRVASGGVYTSVCAKLQHEKFVTLHSYGARIKGIQTRTCNTVVKNSSALADIHKNHFNEETGRHSGEINTVGICGIA